MRAAPTFAPGAAAATSARVSIATSEEVGDSMAGPAIRVVELARVLSQRTQEVLVITPTRVLRMLDDGTLTKVAGLTARAAIGGSDVLIGTSIGPRMVWAARRARCHIIFDAYDPVMLELLEMDASAPMRVRNARIRQQIARWNFSLATASAVLCATDRQRDLLLGALISLGRLSPRVYDADPSLRSLVAVVPFGLPDSPPACTSPGAMRKQFGLADDDFVLIWGGGIWDWFDPLTLVRAVEQVHTINSRVKLVFMGITHPNPNIPRPRMVDATLELARDRGLLGKCVFVNDGWLPYDERAGFLMDSQLGVVTSPDHVESRFAFRTRVLDYLWCGLPIVCTRGDAIAELVENEHLGEAVAPGDVAGLAAAIARFSSEPALYGSARSAVEKFKSTYTWGAVSAPLVDLLNTLQSKPAPSVSRREFRRVVESAASRVRDRRAR